MNNEGDKMSDYTPTTESIKFAYVENAFAARSMSDDDTPAARAYEAELDARFGRWLAARDAEVASNALDVVRDIINDSIPDTLAEGSALLRGYVDARKDVSDLIERRAAAIRSTVKETPSP